MESVRILLYKLKLHNSCSRQRISDVRRGAMWIDSDITAGLARSASAMKGASFCCRMYAHRGDQRACSTHGLSSWRQFFSPTSQQKHLTLSSGPAHITIIGDSLSSRVIVSQITAVTPTTRLMTSNTSQAHTRRSNHVGLSLLQL